MAEVCGECGATFAGPVDLVDHLREGHGSTGAREGHGDVGPPRFVCALCGRRFRRPEALAAHNRLPHPAETPSPARGRPVPTG